MTSFAAAANDRLLVTLFYFDKQLKMFLPKVGKDCDPASLELDYENRQTDEISGQEFIKVKGKNVYVAAIHVAAVH